jgi:hypothetical protein
MKFKNYGIEERDDKTGRTNVRKVTVRVKTHDLDLTVPYGEEVEIPALYATPRRFQNGGRRPSAIEMLAPQLRPADSAELEQWLQVPPEDPKVKAEGRNPVAMSVEALVTQGIPRGIAETLVATYQAALAATQAAAAAEGKE